MATLKKKKRRKRKKGNAHYLSGRKKEWATIALLKKMGYMAGRSAGSKGIIDVFAFDTVRHRLIQVKFTRSGHWKDHNVQRLARLKVPPGTTKEVWEFQWRRKAPIVHYLTKDSV